MADAGASTGKRPPRGFLVIVTGSSHAGKSSLIAALRQRLSRPTAMVAIDDVIQSIDFPPAELWERGLSSAYDAAAAEVERLLRDGLLVFYESTFTYVPPSPRPPEFHQEQLQRLLNLGSNLSVPVLVLHLQAPLNEISRRQQRTGRLTGELVAETWHRHSDAPVAAPRLLRFDTDARSPQELAEWLAAKIDDLGSA